MIIRMGSSVLILTSDTGFGHRSAARALTAAFAAYPDVAVEVANPMAHESVPLFVKVPEANYDAIVKNVPELYHAAYEASNFPPANSMLESVIAVALYDAIRAAIRAHQPDVVISVFPYYQAPLSAYFLLRQKKIPLVTVVTDLTTVQRVWFNPISDLTVVPTPQARQLALEAGLVKSKVEQIGIPVSPALSQAYDKRALRKKLGWAADKTAVLVVGSGRMSDLVDMLRPLNHAGLDIQLALIAGGSKELLAEFNETEWHLPATIYEFADNMPELLHAADCVICKAGGLIVAESLACGLPLILVNVIEGQETGNAQYVIDAGAGVRASDPVDVLETLFHWSVEDQWETLRAKAREAAAPDAAVQIAARALDLVGAELTRPRLLRDLDLGAFSKLLENLGINTQ
jgi:1,2-diacylglycerol 3-beta-galactosyltransferase